MSTLLLRKALLCVFSCSLFLLGPSPLGAQTLEWVNKIQGSGYLNLIDIESDAHGNAYVIEGIFGNTFKKYDPQGNLVWVYGIPGSVKAIASDDAGEIVLAGSFSGTKDFDLGPGTSTLTSTGGEDIFIARYDTSGNYIGGFSFGGGGTQRPIDVDTDPTHGIVVSFRHNSTQMDLQPGPGVVTVTNFSSTKARFVVKYDYSGALQWYQALYSFTQPILGGVRYINGYDDIEDKSPLVRFAPSGEVYAAGYGDRHWALNHTGLPLPPLNHIFVYQFSPTGGFNWGKQYSAFWYDFLTDADVGPNGDLFVSGGSRDAINFGAAGVAPGNSAGNHPQGYVFQQGFDSTPVRVIRTGVPYQAVRTFYGAVPYSVSINGNELAVAGTMAHKLDFDNGPGLAFENATNFYSGYIARYTLNGTYISVNRLHGTFIRRHPRIQHDNNGNYFYGGSLSSYWGDVDPTAPIDTLYHQSNVDSYVGKLGGICQNLPVVATSSDSIICIGDSITLTGSGAQNFVWSHGVSNGVPFTPTQTRTYTLVGIDNSGCYGIDQITVVVSDPQIDLGPDQDVCDTLPLLIQAPVGFSSYLWSTGDSTSQIISPYSPGGTFTYSVTVTDSFGCVTHDTINITRVQYTQVQKPVINLCFGDSVFVAGSYQHASGFYNDTVSGPTGCDSVLIYQVIVRNPGVDLGGDSVWCRSNFYIAPTVQPIGGLSSILWNTGNTSGSQFINSSGLYSVTVTDFYGCTASDSAYITVNPLPATTTVSSDTVCNGQAVTLTVSVPGFNSASWSGGVSNGVPFFPTSTQTYYVTAYDNNQCQGYDTVTVTVLAQDTVLFQPDTICAGDNIFLAGAFRYLSGNYYDTAVSGNFCDTLFIYPLVVLSGPTFSLGNDTTMCAGSYTLDATPISGSGHTYLWQDGSTQPSLTVTSSGLYSVTVTDSNGCSQVDSIQVNLGNSQVNVNAIATSTMVCAGSGVILTGSGALSYSWDNGVQDGVLFVPTATQTYTVTGFDSAGCSAMDSITVTVLPNPTVSANASSLVVCQGDPVTLTGSGASTYIWNNGVVNGVPFVPTITQDYILKSIDANGCFAYDTITVTVDTCIGTTLVQSQYCNTTLSSLNQNVHCDPVVGASQYRWEFTSGSTVLTRLRTGGFTNMQLGWVSGIQYGVTYQVRVQALVNGVWGNYGVSCPLTTPAYLPTQVQTAYCGITVSSLYHTLYCDPVSGATQYEWRFINGTDTLYRIRTNGFTNMQPAWVSGLTYQVSVQAMVGGTYGGFGTSCSITMPAFPSTQVQSSFCGTTLASINSIILNDPVPGADRYEWRFVNGSNTYFITRTNGFLNIAPGWISGIQHSTTYQVSVRARVGGVWNSFGTACAITTPAMVPKLALEPDVTVQDAATEFSLIIYPNPNPGEVLWLNWSGAPESDKVELSLLDISGKVILLDQIPNTGNHQQHPMHLPSGLAKGYYLVRLGIGEHQIFRKLVVQ